MSQAAASRSNSTCPVWLMIDLGSSIVGWQWVEEREGTEGSGCGPLLLGSVLCRGVKGCSICGWRWGRRLLIFMMHEMCVCTDGADPTEGEKLR